MVERMENADLYLGRIRRLEQELAQEKERYEDTERDLATVMENYPSAAAICGCGGDIILSNSLFCDLTCGVPAEKTAVWIESAFRGQQPPAVKIEGRKYSVQTARLSGGRILLVIDDLTNPGLLAGRVAEALDAAVRRQMETVRKIGTILGDETSLTLNDINRAVSLLRSSGTVGETAVTGTDK